MIKAFNPSGENAAALAAGMLKAVVLLPLTMYTWFGVCSVSANRGIAPFCDTARIFPVTVPIELNGLLPVPRFVGLMMMAPKSLPMYTWLPKRSYRKELGGSGRGLSLPADARAKL